MQKVILPKDLDDTLTRENELKSSAFREVKNTGLGQKTLREIVKVAREKGHIGETNYIKRWMDEEKKERDQKKVAEALNSTQPHYHIDGPRAPKIEPKHFL